MNKRILLLSAYDALSHRHWRRTLAAMFPEHDWTQLSLPPRHFSWRIRGNSLSWGVSPPEELTREYDLLITTSLVDLAGLRGLQPALAHIPTLVYFHENQFVYPVSPNQSGRPYSSHLDAALISLFCALCADQVVFNSHYNRRTMLAGVERLLKDLPDQVPDGILDSLRKSTVIPVPLPDELPDLAGTRRSTPDTLEIVWNHRWEYDKGPELLLALAESLARQDLPFRLHLLGQRFRRQPAEFERIRRLLASQAENWPGHPAQIGPLTDTGDYYRFLAGCDVVLSTARHDFQGLAILEGCALGCTPLCPDALVYPEYLDRQFLYRPPVEPDTQQAAGEMIDRLTGWFELKRRGEKLPSFRADAFLGHSLREDYRALFEGLWESA